MSTLTPTGPPVEPLTPDVIFRPQTYPPQLWFYRPGPDLINRRGSMCAISTWFWRSSMTLSHWGISTGVTWGLGLPPSTLDLIFSKCTLTFIGNYHMKGCKIIEPLWLSPDLPRNQDLPRSVMTAFVVRQECSQRVWCLSAWAATWWQIVLVLVMCCNSKCDEVCMCLWWGWRHDEVKLLTLN